MRDPRLPFRDASDQVWEKLRGLRAEVSSLCVKKDYDGDILQPLLEMIDEVHPTHPKEASSNEPGEVLGHVTPEFPLREQRDSVNRSSFSSGSTVVARGRPGAAPTNEDSHGGASS